MWPHVKRSHVALESLVIGNRNNLSMCINRSHKQFSRKIEFQR